ncbi:complex I intermediate-associated protein 30 [Apiospora rasikravindrae]|uniref:Complex I intermediate-associated protein 30 n=1 Tax=Apiospora rasikravindrae TaxID=990691 RepID=A0ABR1SDD4_9PEZI
MALQQLPLLGGTLPWNASLWEAVDDSVRGGNSSSHLTIATAENEATFSGYLDDATLGGAGFASQQTVGSLEWNLTGYDGLLVSVALSDGKLYTLNLKDVLPASNRESSLLYETNFTVPAGSGPASAQDVFLPWANFTAMYRGRPQPDAKPLNTSSIKTMSLMMRSYFGTQEGVFSLTIKSISAFCKSCL